MREGDAVSTADTELWQYFSTLYKNSNKGIKGRGKNRKISATYHEPGRMKREDSDGLFYNTNSAGENASAFESVDHGSRPGVNAGNAERGGDMGSLGWQN
jgi:hypothetical protein